MWPTRHGSFQYPLFEIDGLGRMVLASYGLGADGIWRFNVDEHWTLGSTTPSTWLRTPWTTGSSISRCIINLIYLQPNTWGWPAYLFKLLEDGSLNGFRHRWPMDLSDADPNYYTAPDELLIEASGGLIVWLRPMVRTGT